MPLSKHSAYGPEDFEVIAADVKASRCFGKSTRQLQLFEHLLQHSLAATSDTLTQYSLAIDILGRPESFDPTIDSIVRVELHRLRANLEVYNNSESEYKITVPSASFDVVVEPRNQGVMARFNLKPVSSLLALCLVAAAFGGGFVFSQKPEGPTLIECAAPKPNVKVTYVGQASDTQDYIESVLRSAMAQNTVYNILEDNQDCNASIAPLYDMQFTIVQQDEQLNLALTLLDDADQSIVESHHIAGTMMETQEGTALYYKLVETANSIAMPSGNLARHAKNNDWTSAEAQESFACLIAMYDSYAGRINQEFDSIHACLERSVKSGVAGLDNYGALASSYLDQHRNNRPSSSDDPLKAAYDILEAHSETWVDSTELAIAKLYTLLDHPELNKEQADLTLFIAQSRFKTNPYVLLMVAAVQGYVLGSWDEAKALSDYIRKIYPVRDQSMYYIEAGYLLATGASGETMEPCFKFYTKDSIHVNIIVNACARSENNQDWLRTTEGNLDRANLKTASDRMDYIEARIQDPKLKSRLKILLEKNATE